MLDTTIYTGRLEAVQTVELRSRVSGYLQSIRFKDGSWVQAGTLLFALDPATFAAARDRYAGELRSELASRKLARQKYERDLALRNGGSVSLEALQSRGMRRQAIGAAVRFVTTNVRCLPTRIDLPIITSG